MDGLDHLNTKIPINCIAVSRAAKELEMTSVGLLDLLKRTGSAVRRDGRYFVTAEKLEQIKLARKTLGKLRTENLSAVG